MKIDINDDAYKKYFDPDPRMFRGEIKVNSTNLSDFLETAESMEYHVSLIVVYAETAQEIAFIKDAVKDTNYSVSHNVMYLDDGGFYVNVYRKGDK